MKSKSADGRCVRWGLTLSHWDLEVRKVQRGEDGLAAILGAGITPREHLDEVAETLIPAKVRAKAPPVICVEMLDDSYTGYVLSFDGAAKTSTRQGSSGCVVWELPGRRALNAHGFILDDVTVNDAEYHGILKGMELMSDLKPATALKVKFKSVKLVHVKRDYNQAVDYLTSKTLAQGGSWQIEDAEELRHLKQMSKIPEKLMMSEARSFEVVSMDFVTHMPKSARGNTFLLLFQDMFSGYVMCKPMDSTTAQDVAEAYEERVFWNFGASSMFRHDQDPRFMSEVFTRFRDLLGSCQRATLTYRPQANGQQERSVQTIIRSVRVYVAEVDQSDWDDHAKRLMFALNTLFDATRLYTPFYLGTQSAMLGSKPSSVPERTAYEWRRKFQRDYSYAQT
ncbi:unnamed protein product [Phytophthora fragariaefolia]|uniref:Unnamed protein product n=1 Tax=Phytophthora fragariaefolia TaxID=1490495 RepID=A0A9W6Y0S2_9STRA|nr:unnamed protein product [Phytophthora fragariaefolia]